jgi:hypothetical protein
MFSTTNIRLRKKYFSSHYCIQRALVTSTVLFWKNSREFIFCEYNWIMKGNFWVYLFSAGVNTSVVSSELLLQLLRQSSHFQGHCHILSEFCCLKKRSLIDSVCLWLTLQYWFADFFPNFFFLPERSCTGGEGGSEVGSAPCFAVELNLLKLMCMQRQTHRIYCI